ncbi:hypothetical protein [Fodinicola feengrottensis]|nr:hypothetical protein [Fodinicola feengrottensis]
MLDRGTALDDGERTAVADITDRFLAGTLAEERAKYEQMSGLE